VRTEWERYMMALIGKSVRVTTSKEPLVAQEGMLVSFTDDGEVELEDDNGTLRHCWPNLHCEEIPE
jgi:hypothetical protein